MSKVKGTEVILKAVREKELVMHKGIPLRLLAETLQAIREWDNQYTQKCGKKRKINQPGKLYPAKLSFRVEGNVKCSEDKQMMKEVIITIPALHEMLKGLL